MKRVRQMAPALAFWLLLWPALAGAQTPPEPEPPGQEPSEPAVSREEIEELRRRIEEATRPRLELLFDAHGETGDLNDELTYQRYAARLDLRRRSGTAITLTAFHTPYRTPRSVLTSAVTGLTVGARWRSAQRLEWQLELTGARFDEAWSATGLASLAVRANDALRWSVELRRSNVEDSLLSVAGVEPVLGPFAGERVGAVHDNRVTARFSYRLPARFDLSGEGSLGYRSGSEVESNTFRRAAGGLGWSPVARGEGETLSLLRLSVWLDYLGFDDDRLGYGGASLIAADGRAVPPERLGSDGISPGVFAGHPGVGGYFSPERFVSRVGRVEVRGRASETLDYRASAFLGAQSFTGAERSRAVGVSAGIDLRLSERLTLPVAFTWDDFGPFSQGSLAARLVLVF